MVPVVGPDGPKKGQKDVRLGDGVAAVDTDVSASGVHGRVRQQVVHRAHQVLGLAHAAHGDERGPLLLEVGVVVEDLLGAVTQRSIVSNQLNIWGQNLIKGTHRAVSMYPGEMQLTRIPA